MRGKMYKPIGAVLVLIAIVFWFVLPFLGTTTPTPPATIDFEWHRKMINREKVNAARERNLSMIAASLAGAGLSLLIVGHVETKKWTQQIDAPDHYSATAP